MNYLFLGDTHGDLDFTARAAEVASENDAEIIQVGDWGFIWTYKRMVSSQVKQLSEILTSAGVVMRFIDGNHDHHRELRRLVAEAGGANLEGVALAHNIIYQPRGSVHEDKDGTRFLFLGGAPSIDKDMRTPGQTWWPEEFITEEEFQTAKGAENIDILVTHDAPDYPPGFEPKGDAKFREQSYQSMEYVRRLIWKHNPKLHVHGHWHSAYVNGITRGLDCNYGKFNSSIFLWSPSL